MSINQIECPVCKKLHDYETCRSTDNLCWSCEAQEAMNRDPWVPARYREIAKAEQAAILAENLNRYKGRKHHD